MTGPGGFSISPAEAARPEPVTLSMPTSGGYKAVALLTDPCGHAIPGASVTVAGLTATPHLPPGYHGTVFVDWSVSAATPAASGGRVSLVLASRQQRGKATTCTAGPSPYGGTHHAPAPAPAHHPAAAGGSVQGVAAVAHTSAWTVATGVAGFALLAAALAAGCWLWWRRRHPRGAHR